MARRNPIPWGLTASERRRNKILAGIGVGALVFLVGAGVASAMETKPPPKKKIGMTVAADCLSWTTDDNQIRTEISALIKNAQVRGQIDPFLISQDYLRMVAPRCQTYPGKSQTPKQAELFVVVFKRVLAVMVEQKLVDPNTQNQWTSMLYAWAINQGVDPVTMG